MLGHLENVSRLLGWLHLRRSGYCHWQPSGHSQGPTPGPNSKPSGQRSSLRLNHTSAFYIDFAADFPFFFEQVLDRHSRPDPRLWRSQCSPLCVIQSLRGPLESALPIFHRCFTALGYSHLNNRLKPLDHLLGWRYWWTGHMGCVYTNRTHQVPRTARLRPTHFQLDHCKADLAIRGRPLWALLRWHCNRY